MSKFDHVLHIVSLKVLQNKYYKLLKILIISIVAIITLPNADGVLKDVKTPTKTLDSTEVTKVDVGTQTERAFLPPHIAATSSFPKDEATSKIAKTMESSIDKSKMHSSDKELTISAPSPSRGQRMAGTIIPDPLPDSPTTSRPASVPALTMPTFDKSSDDLSLLESYSCESPRFDKSYKSLTSEFATPRFSHRARLSSLAPAPLELGDQRDTTLPAPSPIRRQGRIIPSPLPATPITAPIRTRTEPILRFTKDSPDSSSLKPYPRKSSYDKACKSPSSTTSSSSFHTEIRPSPLMPHALELEEDQHPTIPAPSPDHRRGLAIRTTVPAPLSSPVIPTFDEDESSQYILEEFQDLAIPSSSEHAERTISTQTETPIKTSTPEADPKMQYSPNGLHLILRIKPHQSEDKGHLASSTSISNELTSSLQLGHSEPEGTLFPKGDVPFTSIREDQESTRRLFLDDPESDTSSPNSYPPTTRHAEIFPDLTSSESFESIDFEVLEEPEAQIPESLASQPTTAPMFTAAVVPTAAPTTAPTTAAVTTSTPAPVLSAAVAPAAATATAPTTAAATTSTPAPVLSAAVAPAAAPTTATTTAAVTTSTPAPVLSAAVVPAAAPTAAPTTVVTTTTVSTPIPTPTPIPVATTSSTVTPTEVVSSSMPSMSVTPTTSSVSITETTSTASNFSEYYDKSTQGMIINNTAQEINSTHEESASYIINTRIEETKLPFSSKQAKSANASVKSAGEENQQDILHSIWTKATYGLIHQGTRGKIPGYKGNMIALALGADTKINEKTTIGIAFSNIHSNLKYKQTRDKVAGHSNILSLYGTYQFNDKLSISTILSAGLSTINTKRLVLNKVAKGKINSKSYNIESSLSYNLTLADNVYFIPNIGLRYGHYNFGSYSEYGADVNNNISIKSKTNSILSGITGITLVIPRRISENSTIIPSLHTSIETYLHNKQQKTKAKFAWMPSGEYFKDDAALTKKAKVNYNLGGGMMIKHNNVEVSGLYNCSFNNHNYQNHQSSIKLELNF